MQHQESWLANGQGLQLYYQRWQGEGATTAIVAIVHGLGGHSGQFQNAVAALVAQGYGVYAMDLRGHGRSPGQRGHINAWAEFRTDVAAFLHLIAQQHPDLDAFLWGHSLGGTVALDYTLRSPTPLKGLILTAPALSKVNLSWVKLALGQILSRTWPRFSLKVGIRHDLCAQDARICAAYAQDPLRHEYGSARLATEFFATVDWIVDHADQLQVPLLLMHGGADQVTLPAGSRAFFDRLSLGDKTYHEYPDNYHDLHVDRSYAEMMTDMQRWIEQHRSRPPCDPLVMDCIASV
jgi:alpha-beta hydrolase superfamily lysophospholipase